MKIKLSPVRMDETLEVSKTGSVLTINGEPFDFSRMAEGDTLPRNAINSKWFAGDVDFADGELIVTIVLPNPINFSPEQAFPADLIGVPDGPVALPQPLPEPPADEILNQEFSE